MKLMMVLILGNFIFPGSPATTTHTTMASGVVIETLSATCSLAKAGLVNGDIILAWRRLPNPPSNPENRRCIPMGLGRTGTNAPRPHAFAGEQ